MGDAQVLLEDARVIAGMGIDIVETGRFREWVDNHRKMRRFFHGMEIRYVMCLPRRDRATSLAARYAAKEALGKALGSGMRGMTLADIAVKNGQNGAPRLQLFNRAKKMVDNIGMCKLYLSLAHTREYATACVIIERERET